VPARRNIARAHGGSQQARDKQVRDVVVPEGITVQELANRMAEKGADVVKALFKMGVMASPSTRRSITTPRSFSSRNSATRIKRVSDATTSRSA
jgi:hypothetical protein